MEMKPTIDLYLEYCMSKQLRPKSMHAYEQGLKLFTVWLEEELEITDVEDIRDAAIRKYILDLQVRGKYTACSNKKSQKTNYNGINKKPAEAGFSHTVRSDRPTGLATPYLNALCCKMVTLRV